MSTLNIEELNVDDDIKKGLKKLNIGEATSLQQKIITNLSTGKGLIVKSNPKEKGDTIAVSALSLSYNHADEDGTSCLILSASGQSVRAIGERLGKFEIQGLTCEIMDEQMEVQQKRAILDKEPGVLVSTPCTLQKTMQKMRHTFRTVRYIILDGLDEMNTSEQRRCLKQIRLRTLSDYTSLIFASKLDDDVKGLSSRYIEEPLTIGFTDSANGQMTSPPDLLPSLKQGFINVPPRMKISTLMALIEQSPAKKTVIFTSSKRGIDRLYKILRKQNLRASSLNGRLSGGKKAQRLEKFASGRASYLLVADISAAELELNDIAQVINYDVPGDTGEYRFRAALLHAEKNSGIVSLVSGQDRSDIQELQDELKTKLTELDLPASVQKKTGNRKKKSRKKQQKKKEMELPRPNYDKLSGGRNGTHDEEESGIIQLFRKFFSP